MKLTIPATVLLTLFTSLPVLALDSMQPGLWESHNTVKSKSGKFEQMIVGLQAQTLKNMTPEERKIYQETLAEEGTVHMGADSITKNCVTKEQAAKMEIPKLQEGCNQQVVTHTGSTVKLKFQCSQNGVKASGTGDFKLQGPKAYTTTAVVNMMVANQPDVITMSAKAKWLSDDCGKIKPGK